MRFSSFWHCPSKLTAIMVLCAAAMLLAQAPPKTSSSKTDRSPRFPKPKLTDQQKLGLRQLEIAQAEAAGLQPDMRAFVLWQASRGYTRIAPAKADSLLKEALTIAQAVASTEPPLHECAEPVFCGPGHWLQTQILRDMILKSRPGSVERLLASAEPGFRQMLTFELLGRYIDEKNFDGARKLLNQLATDEQGYFPYSDAIRLIAALPPDRAGDRVEIFSQALDDFAHHTGELYPVDDDLGVMVLRFWQELPASLVLQAVDQLIDRARDADQKQDAAQQHPRIGVSAASGDAYFGSVYQFRLFQLIPVLEQIDPTRAENLRSESGEVRAALERYPGGLDSGNIGTVDEGNSPEAAAEQASREISRRQQSILREAEKNPRQALSEALNLPLTLPMLPDFSPRASTLQSVARMAIGRNPSVAKEALQEVSKIAEPIPPGRQAQMLQDLPGLYLRLGDVSNARKTLDQLVAIAAKLYAKDADLGDPNRAFKAWWPSANLWWHCIAFAAKLNPPHPSKLLKGFRMTRSRHLSGSPTRIHSWGRHRRASPSSNSIRMGEGRSSMSSGWLG
jgi:hypothetical protein